MEDVAEEGLRELGERGRQVESGGGGVIHSYSREDRRSCTRAISPTGHAVEGHAVVFNASSFADVKVGLCKAGVSDSFTRSPDRRSKCKLQVGRKGKKDNLHTTRNRTS